MMERELPEGWVETTIGEVLSLEYGKSLPAKSRVGDDYPVMGSNGEVGRNSEYLIKGPGIVVGRKGSHGEVNWVEENFFPIDTTYYVQVTEAVDIRYAYNFLRSCDFKSLNRSTAIPGLNRNDAYSVSIPLPPLAEQKRIVAKLDEAFQHLGTLKAKLERIPELLKNFRQAVLTQAVTGKLINSKGFEISLLGKHLIDIKYGTSQKSDYEIEGVPVLRIPNIKDGEIDATDLKFSDLEEKEYEKLRLLEGDVLVIRSNGSLSIVGQSAIIRKEHKDFAYAGYLIRLRTRQNFNPEYLNFILGSNYVRAQIIEKARSTSGVNNINTDEIKSITIPIPPLEEQIGIVKRIEALFAKVDAIENYYANLKERIDKLPQALLAKAFRGELVHQNPNDEPASTLLKQIQEAVENKTKEEKRQKHKKALGKAPAHMKKKVKPVKNYQEFLERLDDVGGSASPSQLLIDSSLENDVDLFYDFLRKGKDSGVLDVPIGKEGIIRRKTNENR